MSAHEPDRSLFVLWIIAGLMIVSSFVVYSYTGHSKRAQSLLIAAAAPAALAFTKLITRFLVGDDD